MKSCTGSWGFDPELRIVKYLVAKLPDKFFEVIGFESVHSSLNHSPNHPARQLPSWVQSFRFNPIAREETGTLCRVSNKSLGKTQLRVVVVTGHRTSGGLSFSTPTPPGSRSPLKQAKSSVKMIPCSCLIFMSSGDSPGAAFRINDGGNSSSGPLLVGKTN